MSDMYKDGDVRFYEEDKPTNVSKTVNTTEVIKRSFNKPSGRFLKLISIFEKENLDMKLKFLSRRRRLTTTIKTSPVPTDDASSVSSHDADVPKAEIVAADGVDVMTTKTNRMISVNPKQSLLVVIHPWSEFHNSAAAVDRQSEFPPPGFLKRLRAKFLALRRETAATVVKRRLPQHNMDHRGLIVDTCWIRYAAAALGGVHSSNDNWAAVTTANSAAIASNDDNKSAYENTMMTSVRHVDEDGKGTQ